MLAKKIVTTTSHNLQNSAKNHIIIVISMPCVHSMSFPINREWAELVRGLRMKVPDDWWPGFSGRALNNGVITCVDFDIDTNNHFQLELDKEHGIFYAMRYDAVVWFAGKMHSSFSSFCLSAMLSAIQQKMLL
jgi:hypothetical protein